MWPTTLPYILLLMCQPARITGRATRDAAEPLPTPQAIINGDEIYIYDYPFLVYLSNVNTNIIFCGGSIVNRWAVLTAGHCVMDEDPLDFMVVGGYNSQGRNIQLRDALRITLHPQFNHTRNGRRRMVDYDYAIVHLEEPFSYDYGISYVTLAKDWNDAGKEFFAMGWGETNPKGVTEVTKTTKSTAEDRRKGKVQFRRPMLLKGITLYMSDYNGCKKNYSTEDITLTDRFFCAYSTKGDTCTGDSGGPIIASKVQYGITSFALGCFREGFPSVYAKIPPVYKWIMKTAGAGRLTAGLLIYNIVTLFMFVLFA